MNNAQKLRKLYKMTQEDISDIIEYPKPLYASFEAGRIPLPKNKMERLARYYNVSVSFLQRESAIN